MSALGRVVRAGVGRRRLQTVVVGLVTAMAVTASVLGGSLLVSSRAPFDTAFADQHGAHLSVLVDAAKATVQQVAETAQVAGVVAAAGPFPTVTISASQGGRGTPGLTVVGRADPGGGVDDVSLTEGRWATGPGELVIAAGDLNIPVGQALTVPDAPGSPTLTVVGVARSMSDTADGWTTPDTLQALGPAAGLQILYRFSSAATTTEIDADRAAITTALPAGVVTSARSWLDVRREAVEDTAVFVPFLVAFGILGLIMSVLIIANVVTGAVAAAVRRIGILKALGFTPGQVVRAYVGQALIPAAVGAVVGVVAGNLLAVPLLAQTSVVYGTPTLAVSWWVDAVVAVGVLAMVAATGWAAALRAGRLRTVDALAVSRTGGGAQGRWASRVAGRLPVPRAVGIGLARPFARPMRAALLLAAIAFGAASVTFSVGLGMSLVRVQVAGDHDTADVLVEPPLRGPGGWGAPDDTIAAAPDPAQVVAAIRAQPGTEGVYGDMQRSMTMAGVADAVRVTAVVGDAQWDGFQLVSGRWYAAPGEAVAASGLLSAAGKHVGDTVTVTGNEGSAIVTIVGEVFESGPSLWADASSVGAAMGTGQSSAGPAASPPAGSGERPGPIAGGGYRHHVRVTSGTDLQTYFSGLTSAVQPFGLQAHPNSEETEPLIAALTSLATLLATLLAAVAALGVLNTVLLDLRDRVHDLGVLKAVGMTPRQTVTTVIASVVGIGVLGGTVGVPIGVAAHAAVLPEMARSAGASLPPFVSDVYVPVALAALVLGGLVIALLGAMFPAVWAARVRTTTALRTE